MCIRDRVLALKSMLNSSSSDAVLNLVLAMLLYNGVETVTDITGTSPQLKSLLQRCYDVCAAKKEQQNKKLRDEKTSLADEVDELKSKVQRMSTMTKQVCLLSDSYACLVTWPQPTHTGSFALSLSSHRPSRS